MGERTHYAADAERHRIMQEFHDLLAGKDMSTLYLYKLMIELALTLPKNQKVLAQMHEAQESSK